MNVWASSESAQFRNSRAALGLAAVLVMPAPYMFIGTPSGGKKISTGAPSFCFVKMTL